MSEQILVLLIAERDRIDAAIKALQSSGSTTVIRRRGRPPAKIDDSMPAWVKPAPAKAPRKKRRFTAQQRKAQGLRMKAFWAARRKAAGKTKS
jgi:hypothetical protein